MRESESPEKANDEGLRREIGLVWWGLTVGTSYIPSDKKKDKWKENKNPGKKKLGSFPVDFQMKRKMHAIQRQNKNSTPLSLWKHNMLGCIRLGVSCGSPVFNHLLARDFNLPIFTLGGWKCCFQMNSLVYVATINCLHKELLVLNGKT